MLYYIILCYIIMLYYIKLYYIILYYIMLCYVILYYVILCYIILLYYILFYYILYIYNICTYVIKSPYINHEWSWPHGGAGIIVSLVKSSQKRHEFGRNEGSRVSEDDNYLAQMAVDRQCSWCWVVWGEVLLLMVSEESIGIIGMQ